LAVHLAERARHRFEQMLDGRLPLVDLSRCRRANLAQLRFGQREKRLVVAFERFVAQRPERVANGVAERRVVCRAGHGPADEDANSQKEDTTDERGNQQGGIDGHEYLTRWSVIGGQWSVASRRWTVDGGLCRSPTTGHRSPVTGHRAATNGSHDS